MNIFTYHVARMRAKLTGQHMYLVCTEWEDSVFSTSERAANCLSMHTSLAEANEAAIAAVRDESNTGVGVLTLDGVLCSRAFAYDVVRGFYYTDPLATDGAAILLAPGLCVYYRVGADAVRSAEPPHYLVESYNARLHTQTYLENICTVRA